MRIAINLLKVPRNRSLFLVLDARGMIINVVFASGCLDEEANPGRDPINRKKLDKASGEQKLND